MLNAYMFLFLMQNAAKRSRVESTTLLEVRLCWDSARDLLRQIIMICYHRHTVTQTSGPMHSHAQSDAKTREKALVYAMSDILYQRFAAKWMAVLVVDLSAGIGMRVNIGLSIRFSALFGFPQCVATSPRAHSVHKDTAAPRVCIVACPHDSLPCSRATEAKCFLQLVSTISC